DLGAALRSTPAPLTVFSLCDLRVRRGEHIANDLAIIRVCAVSTCPTLTPNSPERADENTFERHQFRCQQCHYCMRYARDEGWLRSFSAKFACSCRLHLPRDNDREPQGKCRTCSGWVSNQPLQRAVVRSGVRVTRGRFV